MSAENEEQSDGSARGAGWTWLFWFGVVAVVYVLSIGPVLLLMKKQGWPKSAATERILDVIYAPLDWAAKNTPLGTPLDWYCDLWTK